MPLRPRRHRYGLLAVACVVVLNGNPECENVETCTPTEVDVEHRGDTYAVSLSSGDQPLRGRRIHVQAVGRNAEIFAGDVTLDADGKGRIKVPAEIRAQAREVVASYGGDRTFCPSGDGTDAGTGGP
ncbi:MAG TPA: hypothetical protein VI916_14465 [Acidimicrobiia bacterium]|nr:hypothetical protein [Acidimicrobiia bacterium]